MSKAEFEKLEQKIASREAVVGIIGLGYVGLPLVREFCHAGFRVMGFDVDAAKVESLIAGKSYIRHIPLDLIESLVSGGPAISPCAQWKVSTQDACGFL